MQQENEVIKSGIWGRGGSGRCILPSETRFSLLYCRYVNHSAIYAGLGDTFCRLRPVFDYFAGLRARLCAHRPESTVCNIMFAEAKVSMKQRRTRMLACCGRICSMRTCLHGIAAISILRPALISNIIRNPQVCL